MNAEVNDVVDNIEEYVNEVQGNVVGQENHGFLVLKNLSVNKAHPSLIEKKFIKTYHSNSKCGYM